MSRPKLAAAVVVVVALVVWSVQSFVVDGGPTTPPTAAAAANSAESTPDAPGIVVPVAAGDVSGVPVGYPNNRAGAATAAVNWVASFPRLMRLNPLSLQNTLAVLFSDESAADGIDEVLSDYFDIYDDLGPEFVDRVWIESPLQTSVTAATSTTASVSVWSVVMTGGNEDTAVLALWRTHHIELVWQHNDWKIGAVTVTEGPTPVTSDMSLPSDPDEFVEVDSWVPAVFADTTNGEME